MKIRVVESGREVAGCIEALLKPVRGVGSSLVHGSSADDTVSSP
jgi:hypothetical protein